METLLNIILGLVFLLFVATAITLVGGWFILQTFDKQDKYKEKQINNFDTKTKVSGMGGVGGPIDVIRGKNKNEPREENDPNPNQK
jgi:preprotein translocase subunit YajC